MFLYDITIRNDFSYIKCHASVLYSAHMEPCQGQGRKGAILWGVAERTRAFNSSLVLSGSEVDTWNRVGLSGFSFRGLGSAWWEEAPGSDWMGWSWG